MHWIVVVACLVCQIGMGLGGYVFPVFLKPVADDLGWSRATYAAAQPVMSTAVALAGPLVGRLADGAARPVLVLGSILMSFALWLAGHMETPAEFYVIAVGIGLAVACLGDLPTSAVIASRFERNPGLALGIVFVGSNIGGALGPLIATELAAGTSWRAGFSGIGAGLWLVLLPAALAVGRPSRRSEPERLATRPSPQATTLPVASALRASGTAVEEREQAVQPGESVAPALLVPATAVTARQALATRDFWLIAWALFAFYLYRIGVNTHMVAWLSDIGHSDAEAATRFSAMIGVGLVGKLVAGALSDRVGVRVAAVGNFTLLVAAGLLLLWPRLPGAIPGFLLLHGVATAAEDVVVPLLVVRCFGAAHLGAIYGLLLLALVPGGSAGPLLAGWIYDKVGSYTPVFMAFVVTNLSAVVALALVRGGHADAPATGGSLRAAAGGKEAR